MRITIKARTTNLTDGLRELVRRRAHFALGRFAPQIARVVVTVDDGPEASCQVSVRGRTFWHVLIRDEDPWPVAAVSRAMGRAGRAVARRLDRQLNRRFAGARQNAPLTQGALQEGL